MKMEENAEEREEEEIRFVQKHAQSEEGPMAPLGEEFLRWKRTFWRNKLTENGIKNVVAPMVDQSELAFRMLLRRHSAHLCFTPMLHAHLFVTDPTYRRLSFTTVDGDRPLIVQFCANDPLTLVRACKLVEGMCDGVDLNLGCPQLIAKKGHYGAFLQEFPELIESMISAVHRHCHLPISVKIRVLGDLSSTIAYAQRIQAAGASLLTVHGRTREQKGMYTGLANWAIIKAVKQALDIPVMSNGNIQMPGDLERCLAETGADAIMSAEGVLSNPLLFDGTNPTSFEVAHEYLEFADRFRVGFSAVRAHLFRICHYSFLKYDDLRERNATVCSLRELRENIVELRSRCLLEMGEEGIDYAKNGQNLWSDSVQRCCSNVQSLEELVLHTPHYFCKPYIRPTPNKKTVTVTLDSTGNPVSTVVVPALSEYRKQRRAEIERMAAEAGVSKRQIRKREKRKRGNRKELNRKQTYPKCQRCQHPAGVHCISEMCRRCCKWKCIKQWRDERQQENGELLQIDEANYCKAHGFTPKILIGKWDRNRMTSTSCDEVIIMNEEDVSEKSEP